MDLNNKILVITCEECLVSASHHAPKMEIAPTAARPNTVVFGCLYNLSIEAVSRSEFSVQPTARGTDEVCQRRDFLQVLQ